MPARICLSHQSSGRGYLAPRGLSGFYPAEIAAAGNDDSPLYNDLNLPADANVLLLWLLLAIPLVGVTQATDDAGLGFIGAPDGLHAHQYRALYLLEDGTPGAYTATAYTQVGKRLVFTGTGFEHKDTLTGADRSLFLTTAGGIVARSVPQAGDRPLQLVGAALQAQEAAP